VSGIVTSDARPCVSPSVPRAPICRIAQPAWTPPATCHLVSVDSDLSPQRRHLSQDFRRTCAGDVSGTSSALLVMVTLSWSWGQGDKGRTPCHFGGRELRLQLVGHRPAHHGRRADRQTDRRTDIPGTRFMASASPHSDDRTCHFFFLHNYLGRRLQQVDARALWPDLAVTPGAGGCVGTVTGDWNSH
jgi:hypothetical protein